MLSLWFERRHNVLMARVAGVLSSEDLEMHDTAVLRFLAGRTGVRAIYDLSAVEALAIPRSKIALRGRQPAMVSGQRVVVAHRPAGQEFARIIRDQQSSVGLPEPWIVPDLEQAYSLLQMGAAHFEPV